jgi:uncharacterized membrane protein YeaQ/YmgE (transglycosylase-associated protein family)
MHVGDPHRFAVPATGQKPPARNRIGSSVEGAHMIGTIIGMIIIGAVAGFLARAIVPGKDSMSIPATILLGIVGSFVGGFLASLIFGRDAGESFLRPSNLIGSIIGAIIALLVYNAVSGKKKRSHA